MKDFNPRTHTGCDGLPRGRLRWLPYDFNPRTHTGCDPITTPRFFQLIHFNPRTHTGCDYTSVHFCISSWYFNPRTHTGCDYFHFYSFFLPPISIHAPTRGATIYIL